MLTILHLCCSPRGDLAHSRGPSEAVVARLRLRHPEARVVRRDLATTPPALVDAAFSAAILAPPDFAAPALAASEVLIGELEAADALVIGTPMHNYSVPAVLKAWIDQIVRIHRTFRSTPGASWACSPTGRSMSRSPRAVGSLGRRQAARRHSRTS